MKGPTLVAELHKELKESQNERDKRIEELWRTLGPNKKGELDLNGLQKGLRRIDHRECRGRSSAGLGTHCKEYRG
jgi:solute carrier family 25 (mitochondrial phosphate transporter), member 23/24/25/41